MGVDDICHLKAGGLLVLAERLEVLHVREVVLHLRKVAHAAEHAHNVGQACRKPNGPARDGEVGVHALEQFLCLRRHVGERPTLNRLHHDDGLAVLGCHLVAGARLNPLALPVQIVYLQLHKLHLGMLGKDLVEQFWVVVIREAHVAHQTGLLLLEQPLKAVELLVVRIAACLDAMQQVIVEVVDAGLLELRVEHVVAPLQRVEELVMQLGGKGIALSRIAVHERRLGNVLACKAVVHPCGIEVGKASVHKQVDHLLNLLHVHVRGIVWIESRQAHKAESELLLWHKIHGALLSFTFR